MKRILFFVFFTLFQLPVFGQASFPVAPCLPAQEKTTPENAPITVQYPYEDMLVAGGAKNIFLFGKVNLPAPVELDINGHPAVVHPNGGFIAYVPVENGRFTFLLTARTEEAIHQAVRHVKVPGKDIREFAQKAAFDETEVFPQHALTLLPQDTLDLYARGTPGAQVSATVSGVKNGKKIPMTESAPLSGIYRGTYVIAADQKPKNIKITYYMKGGPKGSHAKQKAPGKIQLLGPHALLGRARILLDGVKLRKLPTSQGNLYPFYRAFGEVLLNGRRNNQYRIFLNERESAWLEETRLELTAKKEELPNHIDGLSLVVQPERTQLLLETRRAVPIRVHEFKEHIELAVYYTDGFTEDLSLDTQSPLIDHINWVQSAKDTITFNIFFKEGQTPWGHGYRYEDNRLVFDLYHRPVINSTTQKPLAGARIALDAGHSPRRATPYDGAVGPTGYLEYEATLALAEDLKTLLEQQGATVLMTRRGNNKMSLDDRYQFALDEKAHILISLHYNALPETADPFALPRGFSVYYNYPHSFDLAQAIHQSFVKRVNLPDNGMIANDVLFIPRIPEMPSILVENAYLILPEQEDMARTSQGRKPFVDALFNGILDFYGVKPASIPVIKKQRPRRKGTVKPAKKTYIKAAPLPVLKGRG